MGQGLSNIRKIDRGDDLWPNICCIRKSQSRPERGEGWIGGWVGSLVGVMDCCMGRWVELCVDGVCVDGVCVDGWVG